MAVPRGLEKGVQDTGLDAVVGIRENTYPLRYLVSHLESHPGDVVGQAVGIFTDDSVEGGSVLLIYLGCQVHGYAVVLKEHHGLAHVFLVLHLLRNGHGHLFADALDL